MSQADNHSVQVCYGEQPPCEGLAICTDSQRGEAQLSAEVKHPDVFRDALLTLADVLASDSRFKPQSREDYLAYLLKMGKGVSDKLWGAQKAHLESKFGAGETMSSPLDPVLTVQEDGLAFEVFSADESAYARLFVKAGEGYKSLSQTPGTTHFDLNDDLQHRLLGMRTYRSAQLEVGVGQGGTATSLEVPYRWVRAFGQMQAASTLPGDRFELNPVDLYNLLFTLRQRKAKTSPRALRYELVPGEVPRLVLEPWDQVLKATGCEYQGTAPKVIRTWGRKRLAVLSRLLPHAKKVFVHLVGPGLPAYYVLELEGATFVLALSGWTDAGWAGIASFDQLSAGDVKAPASKKLRSALAKGPQDIAALTKQMKSKPEDVRQVLLSQMQQGEVLFDMASGQYVARSLFGGALDAAKLKFRDERERDAHRLLDGGGQVKVTRVHSLGTEGVRIEGEIIDDEAHRTFETAFTLDREGRTVDASCTSAQFRRAGLKEGPSVPMIALRLVYERQRVELERARQTEEGRKLIRAETRTLIRRKNNASETYRVSLDERSVVVRWGPATQSMRVQRQLFGSTDAAREEYFARLERLGQKGFIDVSEAEAA